MDAEELAAAKAALRTRMRHHRAALAARDRASETAATTAALGEWWRARGSPSVASYAAMGSELDCTTFHQALWADGHAVVLPRVVDAESDHPGLAWHAVRCAEDLALGWRGILEPLPARCPEVALLDVAAVVVPGLAFDRAGNRLGQGAGFYDRALAASLVCIGVGYTCQLVDRVPIAPHDRRMDQLVIAGELLLPA